MELISSVAPIDSTMDADQPLYNDNSNNNDDFDLDLFNSIMQEQPPDPPYEHETNVELPQLASSSCPPPFLDQDCSLPDIDQDCEQQAMPEKFTQQNNEFHSGFELQCPSTITQQINVFNSGFELQCPSTVTQQNNELDSGFELLCPSTITRQNNEFNSGFELNCASTQKDNEFYSASDSLQSDSGSESSDFSFSEEWRPPSGPGLLQSSAPYGIIQGSLKQDYGDFFQGGLNPIQTVSGQSEALTGDCDDVDVPMRTFTGDLGGANTLDNSKSNTSCNATILRAQQMQGHLNDKQLVDLTSDTDSECEEELTQSSQSKRRFPFGFDGTERPAKAVCVRNPSGEELKSKIQEFQAMLPGFDLSSALTLYTNSNVAANLGQHGVLSRGDTIMPMRDINLNSNLSSARFHMSSGVQDGGLSRGLTSFTSQMVLPKDHNKELIQGLELLNSSFKVEASLEEGVMTVPLLRHQRIALAWMEKRETGTECAGGILADDQGLGKTVSTIALILKAKSTASNALPESVKAEEASLVDLDDDDDGCSMTGLGGISESGASANGFPVTKGRPSAGTLIVCPTSVLRQWASELKEKVAAEVGLSVLLYHGSGRTKDPVELAKHDIVLTTYSIVSMEVPKQPLPEEKEKDVDGRNPADYGLHIEDNISTKKKTGKSKKADVENEKAGPLGKVTWFRVVLDEAQSIKNRRTQAARACWGLRAKRRWCLSGTPIQNSIDDLYSYFRFLKYDPYSVYKTFRADIKEQVAKNPEVGYRSLQRVLRNVLLRRTKSTQIDGKPIITLPEKKVILEQVDFTQEERSFYTNLESESREQFQMYADEGTIQRNYVNILWLLLRLRQACNHPRLVRGGSWDGVGKTSTQNFGKLSDKLSEDKRNILRLVLERNSDPCSICLDAPEDAVVTRCSHVFCRQCLSDRLAQDDSASCPQAKCDALLSSSAVYSWSALMNPGAGSEGPVEPSRDPPQPSSNALAESSKIKAVIKTLKDLPLSSRGGESTELDNLRTEKAIVFSQWTSMLDLLEVSLKKEGFSYRRLDGTMSIQARDRALSDFKQLPEVTIIIMSLKAASLGLNMVTASHVLLIDVWWNPTTEDQAIDRAHRIGQTRTVHVSRFTVKNTIEDRILELQERKRRMVASAFGEDLPADQKTRLSMDDMRYLFRV